MQRRSWRSRAGDRDFRGVSLRGKNFTDTDLRGANFTDADLRGARFVNANLQGANFSQIKAGLPQFWRIVLWLAAILLALPMGFKQAQTGGLFGGLLNATYAFAGTSFLAGLMVAGVFGGAISIHGFTPKAFQRIAVEAPSWRRSRQCFTR